MTSPPTPAGRHRPAIIYTPHGGVGHFDGLVAKPFFAVEKYLGRRTDFTIFVSRRERDSFVLKVRPDSEERHEVVYNGIWPSEFEPLPLSRVYDFDLAFLGELRDLKGVDVLLHAIGQLRRAGQPVRACIAGPGKHAAFVRYRRMAVELGVDDLVVFPGPVDPPTLLARAAVLVAPSRAEALPYSLIEAVARRMPIVATDVGGVPEILGGSADLARGGDADDLARAIRKALSDPAHAHQVAAERWRRAKTLFEAEKMVDETLRIYRHASYGPAS